MTFNAIASKLQDELIEIINSDLTFMVNNLFRDEYKSWEAPDGDDYDSQVVQWYTIKLIE